MSDNPKMTFSQTLRCLLTHFITRSFSNPYLLSWGWRVQQSRRSRNTSWFSATCDICVGFTQIEPITQRRKFNRNTFSVGHLRGRTDGEQVGQIPLAPNHGGRRKVSTVSQVLSSIQSRKTLCSNMGAPNLFLPLAPSNLGTPLAASIGHFNMGVATGLDSRTFREAFWPHGWTMAAEIFLFKEIARHSALHHFRSCALPCL